MNEPTRARIAAGPARSARRRAGSTRQWPGTRSPRPPGRGLSPGSCRRGCPLRWHGQAPRRPRRAATRPARTSAPARSMPLPIRMAATMTISRPMTVTVLAVRCSAWARWTTGARTARPASLTQRGHQRAAAGQIAVLGWLADIGHRSAGVAGADADAGGAADEPGLGGTELLEGGQTQTADDLAPAARCRSARPAAGCAGAS